MDIKDFVKSALLGIVEGVQEAIEEHGDRPGVIGAQTTLPEVDVQSVDFDIAVTASEKTEGSAGASITVIAAKLGADGKLASENISASRIKFKVPVLMPLDTIGSDGGRWPPG